MTVDEAEPYTRLAAVYDEIVVDPCHRAWASYLHELWPATRRTCIACWILVVGPG